MCSPGGGSPPCGSASPRLPPGSGDLTPVGVSVAALLATVSELEQQAEAAALGPALDAATRMAAEQRRLGLLLRRLQLSAGAVRAEQVGGAGRAQCEAARQKHRRDAAAFLVAASRRRAQERAAQPQHAPLTTDEQRRLRERADALLREAAAQPPQRQPDGSFQTRVVDPAAGAAAAAAAAAAAPSEGSPPASPVADVTGGSVEQRLRAERASARVDQALRAWRKRRAQRESRQQPRWAADARKPVALPINFCRVGEAESAAGGGAEPEALAAARREALAGSGDPWSQYRFGSRVIWLRCDAAGVLHVLTPGGVELPWTAFAERYAPTEARRAQRSTPQLHARRPAPG
eukprot:TRINITY_DN5429_c0_g1_i1.p2 TRINITY_DN5429_c0_g1~~TRINITY_DN5429_c0_g1_i1.p2  ORF type:complete len:348 (+),score=100.87 TRINITY_DN5429_c0_g1_i1:73-1116(+)